MRNFQAKVRGWMLACFGPEISNDHEERNHRFIEEALELAQACGANSDDCHRLVDYVFNRPKGEKHQEVGGVAVTLSALCSAHGIDLENASHEEVNRIWENIDKIREKQRNKPIRSPLPQ